MKTESHSINDVLAKNATSFFIPPFQRAYAWGRSEIERYFSDISRIIESELDSNQHDKLEHFFGTVVIKEEKAGFANKSIVVDGQQRLTTTLIFLIALRDVEDDENAKDFITQNYLTNNASTYEDKIKLKQVTKDWDSYRALIKGETPNPGVIKNAYDQFSKLIGEKKKLNSTVAFEHYLQAIQRMNVAVIFLDERPFKGEDPQIIFETLNSLGKPLTLSDLVRNFVLLNMESAKQSETYENTWHPKIEKILTENTSKFFRDYLQYRTASSLKVVSDNNTKELYKQFKEFVDTEFETHNDFINDITRFVIPYTQIISEQTNYPITSDITNNRVLKELLRNIFHDIKAEAFKPFVLGLLEFHRYKIGGDSMSDDTLINSLESIKVYLTRRRLLGLTQGENKNIVLLSRKIDSIKKGSVTVIELLTNLFYRLRLPNDDEIKTSLIGLNFYEGMKKYSKYILGKIEEHNTKVAVDFRNPKITIEHIMPQKLSDDWKTELGDDYKEIHKKYLHNIGNLILTEFNSEIGNKPFSDKKTKLSTSSLNYRLDIISRDSWDEQNIFEHQENMIENFLNAFPLPESLRDNQNWNTASRENTLFSPFDSDAGGIAEGNKPIELHINGKVINVKTWQDVFIKFIVHIYSNENFDFDFVLTNQTELFGREQTVVKWGILKGMIENQIDLSTRYKTMSGKYWDKIKDLSDDELFLHINISSSTCMSRIGNIMDKFSMNEEDVQIKLK